MAMLKRTFGFTIVELMLVIIVISILVTLSVVTYNGAQARARDAERTADVQRIADAISLYNLKYGNLLTKCGGYDTDGTGPTVGSGNGWFSREDTGSYPKSTMSCLQDAGLLKDAAQDPSTGPNGTSSPSSGYAYMKYSCGSGTSARAYVFAKLENGPNGSTNPITDSNVCSGTAVDTSYGMNYYVEVN